MARDCPDRQRGQNWRNDAPGGRPQARIGGGEADADYEVCQPGCGVLVVLQKHMLTEALAIHGRDWWRRCTGAHRGRAWTL